MANQREKPKELWLGLLAVAAALVVLVLIFVSALWGDGPGEQPPETTVPPATTEPEPEANIYGPEDFAYEGDYLTCVAGESMLGIDVSAHQKEIDWTQVAEAGIEFVMVRLGYRGYGTGVVHADDYVQANLQGAREAGLLVGAYFYSQAVSTEEAVEEAEFALGILGDFQLDLPLAYDWEYVSEEARTGLADSRLVTDCALAFCGRIRAAGIQPMVYFNPYWGDTYFELVELEEYPFWLAMYREEMNYPYRVEMWQYTSKGSVPGIAGNVDINLLLP